MTRWESGTFRNFVLEDLEKGRLRKRRDGVRI